MDWAITVPRTVSWIRFEREMDAIADGSRVKSYRVRRIPKGLQVGDRLFVVWTGRVRGWLRVVGWEGHVRTWQCHSTGAVWPAGEYIQCHGPFYKVEGPEMRGFRGIRRLAVESSAE